MSDVEKLMEMISDASRLRGMYDQLCIQIDKLESRNALLEKKVEKLREALNKISRGIAFTEDDGSTSTGPHPDSQGIAKAALEDSGNETN